MNDWKPEGWDENTRPASAAEAEEARQDTILMLQLVAAGRRSDAIDLLNTSRFPIGIAGLLLAAYDRTGNAAAAAALLSDD